jgi:hypothetical protein
MILAIIETVHIIIAMANIALVLLLWRKVREGNQCVALLQAICLNAFLARDWPVRLNRSVGFLRSIDMPSEAEIWEMYERIGSNDREP